MWKVKFINHIQGGEEVRKPWNISKREYLKKKFIQKF